MSIFSVVSIVELFVANIFISFIASLIVWCFYMIYITSTFGPMRAKATASFPKTQIVTEEMIVAEMIRKSPQYSKYVSNRFLILVKIFCLIFLFSLLISIVLGMYGITWVR